MDNSTKEFKKLQNKWYAKLKKEGFEDIEQMDGNLKEWSSSRVFNSKTNGSYYQEKKEYYDSVSEYYRIATHFLNDYKFESDWEKLIWSLHADGVSVRNISKKLRSRNIKMGPNKVQEIMTKLKKEAGLK